MKYFLQSAIVLLTGFYIIACSNRSAFLTSAPDSISTAVEQLEEIKLTAHNGDSLKKAWLLLNHSPLVKKDTVLSATVKYNLARLYAMLQQDSANIFIEQALEIIEPTSGNLKYKALIYNGVGNIRSMEAKEREAGFYYNKAAAIVLSDTTTGLSSEAKSAMLLSAAQNNLSTFQYNLAEKMNLAAIPLSESLPAGHIIHQRVYVQMIQTLNALHRPAQDMAPYLHKLEQLHQKYPDKYNISFLYDSKIQYFETTEQQDSLLHYQLLKIAIDEQQSKIVQSTVLLNNLFVNYCNVSAIYVLFKKPAAAAQFLMKAKKLRSHFPKLIFPNNEILFQKSSAELFRLQGKKDEALSVLNTVVQLQKDIYQSENTQAIAEMNALYQLQAKDQSIRLLNENIKINKLQLQQNQLWLAVSSLTLILLAVTLSFLYYRSRQRRIRQAKEKVLLQQQLLRTQMEPHFIFNTLAAVQSFVRLDKKESAIKYLNRFSRLLRSNLELSRENLVPLNEEIDALENYLSLQRMRFEETFTYTIVQPEDQDLSAIMLPPMLIQPYVENAILHGVDLDAGNGQLEILFQVLDDVLYVEITDSGKSTCEPSDRTHRSLSGTISHERMQLLGQKASIKITKRDEGGTLVALTIPITS